MLKMEERLYAEIENNIIIEIQNRLDKLYEQLNTMYNSKLVDVAFKEYSECLNH